MEYFGITNSSRSLLVVSTSYQLSPQAQCFISSLHSKGWSFREGIFTVEQQKFCFAKYLLWNKYSVPVCGPPPEAGAHARKHRCTRIPYAVHKDHVSLYRGRLTPEKNSCRDGVLIRAMSLF